MKAQAILTAAVCLTLAACASVAPPRQQTGNGAPVSDTSRTTPQAAAPARRASDSTVAKRAAETTSTQRRGAEESGAQRRGAYYKDDGPGGNPPRDLASIQDAQPRAEPLHRWANRPYEVFGKTYLPLADAASFRQRGRASWYGRRFHGQQTSSGELYDMYGMTGAHPTLPIPSYVRVTNVVNGRSVVVRINDRGPFHPDRILDLSYTAAAKLGFAEAGSAQVEVTSVTSEAAQTAAASPPAGEHAAESNPAAAASAAPVVQPAEAVPAAGVYLQVGAFSARDNAESFRVRLYRELAWLNDAVQIVPGGSAFRLHVGPYRSRNDAQAIADRIRAELNFNPIFVIR